MLHLFQNIFTNNRISFAELAAWLGTDMHSHLLPAVDDGAVDTPMANNLATGLHALGYRTLITTPHQLAPVYLPDAVVLEEAFGHLASGLVARYAREYMADDMLMRQVLEAPDTLRCLKDNWLLTEFSYAVKPYRPADLLFTLSTAGFAPVLAHPERYSYFSQHSDDYENLLDYGCRFQLNALSLGGYYGNGALRRATYLLQQGLVHFIGTDVHGPRHLEALQKMRIPGELMQLIRSNPIQNQEL